MTKILNLDKLSKASDRALKLNGNSHAIVPMSVENFIETTRAIEKVVKDGGTLVDQIEATVDMICRCVPTAPRAELIKYDLEMLNTIATFVRGEEVDEQEAAAVEEAGK